MCDFAYFEQLQIFLLCCHGLCSCTVWLFGPCGTFGPLRSAALLINGLSRYWTPAATRPCTKVPHPLRGTTLYRADRWSRITKHNQTHLDSRFRGNDKTSAPVLLQDLSFIFRSGAFFYLGLSRCRRNLLRGPLPPWPYAKSPVRSLVGQTTHLTSNS